MRVDITASAAVFAQAHGGTLWVWAAYPRLRCDGMQAWMHVATREPPGRSGFLPLAADGVEVRFRRFGSRDPEVLQIALRGRRRPRLEAYWDGCLYAT
ncbi:MAG TPA: hypothetical protein VN840_17565 [Streptosporangiaceae bacterium]|nr:hypothetical protein [Streptosporangiaceae bacterium]